MGAKCGSYDANEASRHTRICANCFPNCQRKCDRRHRKGALNNTAGLYLPEVTADLEIGMRNEWGVDGINVNLISPIALTEGVKAWSVATPELYEKMLAGTPLRKVGDPEDDIGRVAVFLASEDAKYITGQTLMVDGGSIMLR